MYVHSPQRHLAGVSPLSVVHEAHTRARPSGGVPPFADCGYVRARTSCPLSSRSWVRLPSGRRLTQNPCKYRHGDR